MRSSERGFLGSSSLMHFLMSALTLSEPTWLPSSSSSALLKKNLSSYTPKGVATYLLVVMRLTVDSCMLISSAMSFRISGLNLLIPSSKKPRWCFTILSTTLYNVRCRWCRLLISHAAERIFSLKYSFSLLDAFSDALSYTGLKCRFGRPSSLRTMRNSPSTL